VGWQTCKNTKRKPALFLFLLVGMMWNASAIAQSTTARLSGTVQDNAGRRLQAQL